VHREFKLVAAIHGMSMVGLLRACLYEWIERHGGFEIHRIGATSVST
jgi:hypothetical protein